MKLRVLIGPAGSGKTFQCMEALRACERAGRPALLVVPDQFTYAADRLLLDVPDFPGTRHVHVLSFTRMAHLHAERARLTARVISEQGRRMLLRRIVQATPPEMLGPLERIKQTNGFIDSLASSIKEIKGLAGERAAEMILAAAGGNEKLRALGDLIAAYDRELAERALADPEEWHEAIAADLARDAGPWTGHALWIDGFATLTPAEKALLRALAHQLSQTTLTLCADPEDALLTLKRAADAATIGIRPHSPEFADRLAPHLARPAHLPTLRTLLWLDEALSGRLEIEQLPARSARYTRQPGLAHLEHHLFRAGGLSDLAAGTGGAALQIAAHPQHEVESWARMIDRWTRLDADPIRYRDIVILVRDLETYQPLVSEIFRRYRLPFFIDERRDVTAHPLLRLTFSALALAVHGWMREHVIALLRNPILAISPEAVDRIENLSLEYGIEYERWLETDWEIPELPPPQEAEGEDPGAGEAQLKQRRRRLAANEARAAAVRIFPPLHGFTELFRKDTVTFADAAAALEALIEGLGREGEFATWSAEENERIAALLDDVLEGGGELMGPVPVSAAAFTRLLKDALSHTSIGLTPRTLDAVMIAEPRRSRVNEARRVIVGGLEAQGFARPHDEDPLLTIEERAGIARAGLPLISPAQLQAEEDPYLFYVVCTRATEQLVFTYPATGADGAGREPAAYLREVARIMGPLPEALAVSTEEIPLAECQHTCEVPARLAATLHLLAPEEAELFAREAQEHFAPADADVPRAVHCYARTGRALPDALGQLFAEEVFPTGELRASASRLETFAQCPFRHFAKNLLRLEKRPEAVLTPRSTGGAAHEALQKFFADRHTAPAELRAIFKELAADERYRIFQTDPPSAYRWERTAHHLEFFARTELARLKESAYAPAAFELAFGLQRTAPEPWDGRATQLGALELPIDADAAGLPADRSWRVRLRGKIDRLDLSADGREALIIDYKLGKQKEHLAEEMARGLNLQAAIYLLAVRDLLHLTPAGAIYYSLKPSPIVAGAKGSSEANRLKFIMRGMISEEAENRIDPPKAFFTNHSLRVGTNAMDTELERVRAQVCAISTELLRGSIQPYPAGPHEKLPCRYCDYRTVCRFDEQCHRIRGIGDA